MDWAENIKVKWQATRKLRSIQCVEIIEKSGEELAKVNIVVLEKRKGEVHLVSTEHYSCDGPTCLKKLKKDLPTIFILSSDKVIRRDITTNVREELIRLKIRSEDFYTQTNQKSSQLCLVRKTDLNAWQECFLADGIIIMSVYLGGPFSSDRQIVGLTDDKLSPNSDDEIELAGEKLQARYINAFVCGLAYYMGRIPQIDPLPMGMQVVEEQEWSSYMTRIKKPVMSMTAVLVVLWMASVFANRHMDQVNNSADQELIITRDSIRTIDAQIAQLKALSSATNALRSDWARRIDQLVHHMSDEMVLTQLQCQPVMLRKGEKKRISSLKENTILLEGRVSSESVLASYIEKLHSLDWVELCHVVSLRKIGPGNEFTLEVRSQNSVSH